MWDCLVDSQDYTKEIEKKVTDIYHVIVKSDRFRPFGVLGGYSGVLLFLYYYHKHFDCESHKDVLLEKTEFVYSEFLKAGIPSFCNGIAGICWLFRFLHKEGVIQCTDIDNVLVEIDELLLQCLADEVEKKNFDFLHGALGIAYYFLFGSKDINQKAIKLIIKGLDESKVECGDGSSMWLFETYTNFEYKGLVCNLSLSHGMGGVVAYLTKLLQSNTNYLATELLRKSVLFYLST